MININLSKYIFFAIYLLLDARIIQYSYYMKININTFIIVDLRLVDD